MRQAIGLDSGQGFLLTLDGDILHELPAHTKSVTCMRIDDSGSYVASSADDGKLHISQTAKGQAESFTHSFGRPVKCFALGPTFHEDLGMFVGVRPTKLYSVSATKRAFTARQLTAVQEDYLRIVQKRSSDEVIDLTIHSDGRLLACLCRSGVRVLDIAEKALIRVLDAPNAAPEPHLCTPRISWAYSDAILPVAASLTTAGGGGDHAPSPYRRTASPDSQPPQSPPASPTASSQQLAEPAASATAASESAKASPRAAAGPGPIRDPVLLLGWADRLTVWRVLSADPVRDVSVPYYIAGLASCGDNWAILGYVARTLYIMILYRVYDDGVQARPQLISTNPP